MSSTPLYDVLSAERRLEIERRLYERAFGTPFTDRSIPAEPSERQREYLISCIRDAIYREGASGSIPPHEHDLARELTARAAAHGSAPAQIITRRAHVEEIQHRMRRLCESDALPHRLERHLIEVETLLGAAPDGGPATFKQWVAPEQILPPDGTDLSDLLGDSECDPDDAQALREKASSEGPIAAIAHLGGVECRVLFARMTGIPRSRMVEKCLKPLGYARNGARGGTGFIVFEKTRDDGAKLGCQFDFGTWRQTVMAVFGYSASDFSVRLPVQYWREAKEVPIVTKKLFERTMENVAFVVGELESYLTEA